MNNNQRQKENMMRTRTRLYEDEQGRIRTVDIVGGDFIINDPKGLGDGSFANVRYFPADQFAYIIDEDVTSVLLTVSERDAVLAALRLLQCQEGRISEDIAKIATNEGEHPLIESYEIDNLCEYLNQ